MKEFFLNFFSFTRFMNEIRAATAIEYSLIAAGIALAIVVVVFLIGGDVLALFQDTQSELSQNIGQ